MSVNRENVVWESKDGTWNIGFYAFEHTSDPSNEDFDHEWDVEYLPDFNWVSTGHPTEQAAIAAWRGANPGGNTTVPRKGNETDCDEYDRLAADYRKRADAERRAVASRPVRW